MHKGCQPLVVIQVWWAHHRHSWAASAGWNSGQYHYPTITAKSTFGIFFFYRAGKRNSRRLVTHHSEAAGLSITITTIKTMNISILPDLCVGLCDLLPAFLISQVPCAGSLRSMRLLCLASFIQLNCFESHLCSLTY